MTNPTVSLTRSLAGRYDIQRELGEGGMATVYLAHDRKHDRKVALKVLKPELAAILGAERFLNEIKVTANLQHPNILPLYDSGEAESFLYYVMPYVEGETLRQQLQREHQLGVDEALEITKAVGAALQFAHERGVVHRDIKPENILLQSGQALVADFGIALAVSQAGGTRLTQTGLSLGTPSYMSPEQATGDRVMDARSDQYSLGCMLYEMLVGEPPHVGNSVQAIIAKILSERPSAVSQTRDLVPPNVDAAVQKALAKSPADRFKSVAEFVAALGNAAFVLPTTATTVLAASARRSWRDRAALPLLGAAVLLLGAALWGWLRPGSHAASEDVARVPLVLPDSATLQQQFGILFALSDDGKQIVYVGPGDNDIDLWSRPLNALSATRIPGTNGGDSPFLSPDGEVVAFYRNSPNALFTVSLRGGPRQTLVTDSLISLGGDWGPDGSVYFTRRGGLRRLLPGSGLVEAVTHVDSVAGEVAHAWVDVLPSGKAALFTIERPSLDQYDIAVVDLRSKERTVLVRGTYARYAPTGHIVFASSDGALNVVAFDERTLKTQGRAQSVVRSIVTGERGVAHFAVSPAGALLYGTGTIGAVQSLEWVDRTGRGVVVDTTLRGPFTDMALSPDGRHLAISQRDGSSWNVWVKELDMGPMSKLTTTGVENFGPAWTPDGRSVIYVAPADANVTKLDLMVRRADGSGSATPIVRDTSAIEYGFLSPDGEWVVYQTTQTGRPTRRDIFARRLRGDTTTVPIATSPGQDMTPRLSPDGRWLAYTVTSSARDEVFVSPFPNTATSRWQVSLNGGTEPLWARNGKELFYMEGQMLVAARVETSPTFRVVDRTPLFSRGPFNRDPASGPMYEIAPDGRRFLMTRIRGESSEELVLVLNWLAELRASVPE